MRMTALVATLVSLAVAYADPPTYADKTNLLFFQENAKLQPVKSPADWEKRRAHVLESLQLVMGKEPTFAKPPLDPKVTEEKKFQKYTRKTVTFAAGPKDNRVSAYLFVPHNLQGKTPAVLCLHPTSKELGKGVPAGLGPKYDRAYAIHLVERGYITLAPDYINSGGYQIDPYALGFASATMLGIWNHRVCVDYLQSLPEVDGANLGVIGHSLGGHNSMFVAAFEPRLKAIVSSCGFCAFPKYMKGDLKGWSHAGYMPRIKELYDAKPEKMPFDFTELTAILAPRAFLAVAPIRDHNFDLDGVKDCIASARPVYDLLGAGAQLAAVYPDAGHDFPEDGRAAAYQWFDRWLKGK